MAKATNGTGIVKSEPAGAIVAPTTGGMEIEGLDQGQTESLLGRLAMYNGTKQEAKTYAGCGFEDGDWFDVLEKRKIGKTVRVVPVFGFLSWVRFDSTGQIIYSTRNRREVPPADLAWPAKGQLNAEGKRGPLATEVWNYVVLVEGSDYPMLLRLKRTGIEAAKTIAATEERYKAVGTGHRLYELSHVADSNEAKQDYIKVTAKPVGVCPESLMQTLVKCKAAVASFKAQAEQAAGAEDGEPDLNHDDGIPV